MQTLLTRPILVLLAILLAVATVAMIPVRVSANGDEELREEVAQADTEESEPAPAGGTYNYTAQAGDSFSLIARKAVQTYGLINNVNLSQAQIIAAETYLTQASGSPELNEGQAVSVEESAVKSAVERAQGLSEAAQKLWQKYADSADFNTNNVGQAHA